VQIHGYDPGTTPPNTASGLLWVARIPKQAVDVHLGDGKASMNVSDLAVTDWKTNANSLTFGALLGPGVPATVSFDINWSGMTRKVQVSDATKGYAGLFVETGATMTWSSSQKGFTFVSDAAKTTVTAFAEIGHEHNGTFFPGGDDGG
jgi:hypothetical protein